MNKRAIRFFIILILVIIVVIVANISMRNFGIAQINITVEYAGGDTLIDKRDVSTMLSKRFGNPLSKKRKEVNGEEIEEYLLKQNFVASANVYLTLGGKLNVEVRQNRPIARIYTSDGGQFYVDENKEVCDISKTRAANVLIVNGDLQTRVKRKTIIDSVAFPLYNDICNMVLAINKDDILKHQIDQIYYSKKKGFQLLPKVGDYVILLGSTENMEEKLNKLHYLYKYGFSKHGWDNYSEVNLEFNNQVICTRK
ncbi:MAG: hypothetical protein MSH09_02805 [Bacteroidales bacterium]|nr:hypothetical protein [Bacteroidales bacterium]